LLVPRGSSEQASSANALLPEITLAFNDDAQIILLSVIARIFDPWRDSLWYGRWPEQIRKRPLSEERVLDGADLIRVMKLRSRSILSRILAKTRH
jgi:hypothetical protein